VETLSDAEVMLRVGAGDDSAFDYLVENFARPGQLHVSDGTQSGVAEELAQEVSCAYIVRAAPCRRRKVYDVALSHCHDLAVNHARDTRRSVLADTVCLDEPMKKRTMLMSPTKVNSRAGLLRQERRQHSQARDGIARASAHGRAHAQVSGLDYKQIAKVLNLGSQPRNHYCSAPMSHCARSYRLLFNPIWIVMNCNQARDTFFDIAHSGECRLIPRIRKSLSIWPAALNAPSSCRRATDYVCDDDGIAGAFAVFQHSATGASGGVEEGRAMAQRNLGWLRSRFWIAHLAAHCSRRFDFCLAVAVGLHNRPADVATPTPNAIESSTAVSDLQKLDKNHDLYSDFDLLDDLRTDSSHSGAAQRFNADCRF